MTKRVASSLPGTWRSRLTDEQQELLVTVLSRFPGRAGLDPDDVG